MNKAIILSSGEDDTSFLNKASAYDIIESAIAIFNGKLELVYQNNSFKRISSPGNKQSAAKDSSNLICDNEHIISALKTSFDSKKSISQNLSIPFNSKISLDISISIRPIIDQADNMPLVMLTVEEESISSTFVQRIKHQEKFNTLVKQIQKLTEGNQHKNELIKTLLTQIPFAVMLIDENQQIIQANQEANIIFTKRSNNIIGMHCKNFFQCYQQTDSCPVIHNYDSTFKAEVSSSESSGINATFLRHSSAIRFNNKPAVLEAFIDISEKNKYEQNLVKAKVEADLANESKTEFLSNMSHELRTPLHAILSFSRFGINKIDSPREKILTYFEKIQISGNTLLRLLNNLLDLSKLEAGKVDIQFIPASLDQCCIQVIDEFKELVTEKKIQMILDGNTSSLITNMDSERIKQVIRNLVGNAVKFSPEGGRIVVSTFVKDESIYFCIDDNGPGVPNGELENVFNKFVQSSKTKTGAGGTGLGLSICREIINQHFGEIWAAKSSQGGRFLFKIPIINMNE